MQSALAFAYERKHTKDEVLTAYLNTVYFGDGAYGAEEAAQRYFGKSAGPRPLGVGDARAVHAPSTYVTRGDIQRTMNAVTTASCCLCRNRV